MNTRRPVTTTALLLVLALALSAGTASAVIAARVTGGEVLAATGALDTTPYVIGGAVFLGVGGLLLGLALYAHHRAALRADLDDAED